MEIATCCDRRVLSCWHPYPSEGSLLLEGEAFPLPRLSTAYGYVLSGTCRLDGRALAVGEYFSAPAGDDSSSVLAGEDGALVAVFVRHGFRGQYAIGRVEQVGRVCYVDGCTDSLLVYPPRLGDPCLNSLHFPPGVNQTFHTHPTVRLGVIAAGEGVASVKASFAAEPEEMLLTPGCLFMLTPHELHRFRTPTGKPMTIIAYHPDSDWGPTDTTHPMINRTYLRSDAR